MHPQGGVEHQQVELKPPAPHQSHGPKGPQKGQQGEDLGDPVHVVGAKGEGFSPGEKEGKEGQGKPQDGESFEKGHRDEEAQEGESHGEEAKHQEGHAPPPRILAKASAKGLRPFTKKPGKTPMSTKAATASAAKGHSAPFRSSVFWVPSSQKTFWKAVRA